jgi:type II secretory pathway component PulM
VKKYFAQLRPLERRIAVGTMVILFVVLNWVFVKPHFSDWGNLKGRLATARQNLERDNKVIAETPKYQSLVNSLQGQGGNVAPEDQSINMMRNIQAQSQQSGVHIDNTSRQITRTNDAFFVEQVQNINVDATDAQLVDFLYKLGAGASMVRVLDLELQPDAARQKLNAGITLVASYQKNPSADNLKPATAKAK